MRGWGTGVECQSDCNPPGLHYYLNTTIQFKEAEPDFALGYAQGATFTTPVTADGGITWTVEKMTIPATQKITTTQKSTKKAKKATKKVT